MVATYEGSAQSAWELVEWDWVQTHTGLILHHVKSLVNPMKFDEDRRGFGTTTCGVSARLNVPGIFSRMDADRCKRCCRTLGLPPGVGSPKNDEELRPWVEKRLELVTW